MASPQSVVTEEIQIIDDQGNLRIALSAKSGKPAIALMKTNGDSSVMITLDEAGRPALRLRNFDPVGLEAVIEIDEKGAHVKLDRPGGASSYLFLNNAGGSGVVLIDAQGVRRLEALVLPDGAPRIARFEPNAKAV